MSVSDLSFVKNFLDGDKMDLASQLAYTMFKVGTICSLVSARWGDILAMGNPSHEMGNLKRKAKAK